jgi:cation transport ATPase
MIGKEEKVNKRNDSIVGGLLGGGVAALIQSLWMVIHGFLAVPSLLYWNIYWVLTLIFMSVGVIITIAGLIFKKKHQVPWFRKEPNVRGVILLIITGSAFISLPALLYATRSERIFRIKPYLETEFWLLCLFCTIAGVILIIRGLMLKKKYKITFSKK